MNAITIIEAEKKNIENAWKEGYSFSSEFENGVMAAWEALWAHKDGYITEEEAVDAGYSDAVSSIHEIEELFRDGYDEYLSKDTCKAIDLAYEILKGRVATC